MPVKQELTQACQGQWKTEMFKAPCERPDCFAFGCCCICCATYKQREELLDLTGEPYVCCAGLCPCGPLGQPCSDRMPWLCCEVCCCSGLALSGNRYMVQTRFDKMNTPCDDCIITATCICVCAYQIAQCFVDLPDGLDLCVDLLVMSVQGCMHAQQQIEIEEVKKNGYQGMSPMIMSALPPKQQSMMQQSGFNNGGGGGYPQPTAYGGGQPPYQQNMGQSAGGVQVKCGSCNKVFGSPQRGVTVQCPFCQTSNNC
ncbi:unnamed protein product [Polarella glacialis]|uniref:Uncharacterized protein n=1 Tax=Polarella glacialis TaxID=89957 RepID=A0A813EZZ3_POLGL|nr:unnamed protein product [Polarella glacialis]CAE8618907.1 unnamed protein product [Polarella glacialis]CAE8650887.1 unnamed protein product [Polarella glacialis]|mmetsp:Transcript_44920/g.72945  ORF Transcript_44920/g.72945 Transcript_44920/m.72945 type:complete len:256 (+) Transcript_44920:63-830(+)|eukprot:CAMPEP_0115101088 /NCGR_PEP_ID=MMETSP0227-20121206/32988_1 /TAXON_ID=89957 /ORGANISM="Polarella glacialis, Strain CCMP 1383" /LENGTH=255 /DNA_ID=CAMNT_0002496701 /DNA_START=58 /DNA_END=825 /DNA_ORIENTATION=+